MNSIEIIKEHKKQIDMLLKIRKTRSYMGVGLKVDVATTDDDCISINFGPYSGIEEQLIDMMINGLRTAKDVWIKNLVKEKDEIEAFLKEIS